MTDVDDANAGTDSSSSGAGPEDPVLPEQTSDDVDSDWRDRDDARSDDDRYLRERPPHWE